MWWIEAVTLLTISCIWSLSQTTDESCRSTPIVLTIDQPGCIAGQFVTHACRGQCHSYTQYSQSNGLEHHCTCCSAMGRTERRILLRCKGSGGRLEARFFQVTLPTGCMCRPCSDQSVSSVPKSINPTDLQSSVADFLALA